MKDAETEVWRRLLLRQMSGASSYATDEAVISGQKLESARRRVLHDLINARTAAPPDRPQEEAWRRLSRVFRMKRRISGIRLDDFVVSTLMEDGASRPPDETRALSRFVRRRLPDLVSANDDVRVATMSARNVTAIRRMVALHGASLATGLDGFPAGTPARMDRTGRWRLLDDAMGLVVPQSVIRAGASSARQAVHQPKTEAPCL